MAHSYVEYSDGGSLVRDPRISVVMPTYNHEPYLHEAIQGVVQQQIGMSFELIIGDDCSTDRTKEIALQYQRKYPRVIRVLSSETRVGMHENDARVFAAARGQYMAFCEGDDWWHRTDKLEEQIALMESDPTVSLVCSNWRTASEDGTVLVPDALGLDNNCTHAIELDDILSGMVKTVTVCTRTQLILRALQESPLCRAGRYPFGDAPLWVEVSRHGRCLCLARDYATYRLSRESATRPRDIMDVYRFIAGASEFDRDVLGLYSLAKGEDAAVEARICATRKRLRALALLGEASKVREELWWLCRLGAKISFRDYLLYLGSILSQPGTLGAASRRWALLKWHSFASRRPRVMTTLPVPRQPVRSPKTVA